MLRFMMTLFPAAYCVVGVWYAFGLLVDGWRLFEGGAPLRTLGGLMAVVEAMTAAALVFGIVAAKHWRWRAFAAWAATCLLCAGLYGVFGIPPEGTDRVRLLVLSLGGTGMTLVLVARQLVVLTRRAA